MHVAIHTIAGYAAGYSEFIPGKNTGYGEKEAIMPLTDTQCRTAKPKEKPYKLTDGNGLYLEVKPNGVKAWRYRFELSDGQSRKESVFAIGDYVIAPKAEPPSKPKNGEMADDSRFRKHAMSA